MMKAILLNLRMKTADERGATAIEYGMITAAISVAIMVVLNLVGTDLTATFQSVSDFL